MAEDNIEKSDNTTDDDQDTDRIVQIIPGTGWVVWRLTADDKLHSEPLVAWGLTADGYVLPIELAAGAAGSYSSVVDIAAPSFACVLAVTDGPPSLDGVQRARQERIRIAAQLEEA